MIVFSVSEFGHTECKSKGSVGVGSAPTMKVSPVGGTMSIGLILSLRLFGFYYGF